MSFLWSWRSRRLRNDDGFTLVEVIAAMLVFALAASGVVVMLVSTLRVSRKNHDRVVAAEVAAQVMQTDRDAIKNGVSVANSSSQTFAIGSTTYTVATTASWINVGATGSSCTGAVPGDVAYRRIDASVTWPRMQGTPAVTSSTLATPLSPNSITIPVQVLSSTKAPDVGLTVTLTPPTGAAVTGVTDTNGCVIFAQLTPQKYTVNLNATGYVDTTSTALQNHSEQVGQTIPGVTQIDTIYYDKPAYITTAPSFTALFTAATYPLPSTGMVITVNQTGWSDGSSQVYSATAGVLTTPHAVFPFQVAPGSGYSAFAGGCTSANVAATTATTALGTPVSGATAALNLPVISRTIIFKRTISGVPTVISGGTVTALDSPNGCTDTYGFAAPTSTLGVESFSLPTGSYIFKVKSGATTYTSTAQAVTASSATTTIVTVS